MKGSTIIIIILAALLILWGASAYAKSKATQDSIRNYVPPTNTTPIDMADGLYPGGVNTPPTGHMDNYILAANQITPRNAAGIPADGGRIGFLAVGASNPVKEWDTFAQLCIDTPETSESITYVNGCIGGVSFEDMVSGASAVGDYFARLKKSVEAEGITAEQVQAVWLKSDCLTVEMWDMTQTDYINYFADTLTQVLGKLYTTFPNLQVVYTSGRNNPYVDASSDVYDRHGGPRAYYNQLGIRETITRQITGDPALVPMGTGKTAPILIWVSPLYTDPKGTPNSFGHVWTPDDVIGDGLHPTEAGAQKVASYLLQGFTSDPQAQKWLFAA